MGVMGAFLSRILHLLAELERPVRILQAVPSSLPVISPSDPSAPSPAFPTAGLPGGCREGRTSGKVELPQLRGFKLLRLKLFFEFCLQLLRKYWSPTSTKRATILFYSPWNLQHLLQKSLRKYLVTE